MELAILGVLICQLLVLLFALVQVKRLKSSLITNALSYFDTPEGGKQSLFADTIDSLAGRLAAAIIASLKAWLLSQNSIAVRQDKAAAREAMQAAAPPMLNMLMKYQPGLAKIANKNPELAQLAFAALQNMGRGGGGAETQNNGHEPQAAGFSSKI